MITAAIIAWALVGCVALAWCWDQRERPHSPPPYEPSREELASVSQAEAEARGWI